MGPFVKGFLVMHSCDGVGGRGRANAVQLARLASTRCVRQASCGWHTGRQAHGMPGGAGAGGAKARQLQRNAPHRAQRGVETKMGRGGGPRRPSLIANKRNIWGEGLAAHNGCGARIAGPWVLGKEGLGRAGIGIGMHGLGGLWGGAKCPQKRQEQEEFIQWCSGRAEGMRAAAPAFHWASAFLGGCCILVAFLSRGRPRGQS